MGASSSTGFGSGGTCECLCREGRVARTCLQNSWAPQLPFPSELRNWMQDLKVLRGKSETCSLVLHMLLWRGLPLNGAPSPRGAGRQRRPGIRQGPEGWRGGGDLVCNRDTSPSSSCCREIPRKGSQSTVQDHTLSSAWSQAKLHEQQCRSRISDLLPRPKQNILHICRNQSQLGAAVVLTWKHPSL